MYFKRVQDDSYKRTKKQSSKLNNEIMKIHVYKTKHVVS